MLGKIEKKNLSVKKQDNDDGIQTFGRILKVALENVRFAMKTGYFILGFLLFFL